MNTSLLSLVTGSGLIGCYMGVASRHFRLLSGGTTDEVRGVRSAATTAAGTDCFTAVVTARGTAELTTAFLKNSDNLLSFFA